jgi:hypothetical protein
MASPRKGGYMETKWGGTSTNVQPKKVGAWARMVAEYSWTHLWLAEIGCILFVLGGIFILHVDPKEWLMAWLTIVAFGCGAIIIAVELIMKWRQASPDSGEMMSTGEAAHGIITNDESAGFTDVPVVWGGKYVMEKDSSSKGSKTYRVKDGLGNRVCLAEVERQPWCGAFRMAFLSVLAFPALFLCLQLVSPKSPFPIELMIFLGICLSLLGIMVAYSFKWKTFLVCRGGINNEPVLRIRYRCQLTLRGSGNYAIDGPSGELIGYLRPNGYIKSRFWSTGIKCYRPDLSLLCQISEPVSWGRFVWAVFDLCLSSSLSSSAGSRLATDFEVIEPTESRVIGTFAGDTIEVSPEANMDGRVSLAMGLMICDQLRYVC